MLKYEIIEILEALAEKTGLIATIINSQDANQITGSDSSDELAMLYRSREALLDKMANLKNNEPFKTNINDNSSEFNSILEEILRLDEKNLDFLRLKTTFLANKIKEITKQRSLLIYSDKR